MTFYGVIEEIWELNYHQFRLPLFKCAWVENSKGITHDEELGFILVNLIRRGHRNDEFVIATQVKQVFYIDDSKKVGWSVIREVPNTFYAYNEELGDTLLEHKFFPNYFQINSHS